jgi:hypothetical protein
MLRAPSLTGLPQEGAARIFGILLASIASVSLISAASAS